jgi:hypothetical protein
MSWLPSVLGYRDGSAGINNQKLALLGLFATAWQFGPRRVALPLITDFDVSAAVKARVPFGEAFDPIVLRRFASRLGIEAITMPQPPPGRFGDYFRLGCEFLTESAAVTRPDANGFCSDFFRHLCPLIAHSEIMDRLQREVFEARGVQVVLHLRIEKDWAQYARTSLYPVLGKREEYAPSFQRVMEKVAASLPEASRGVYVACDEGDLPVTRDFMRQTALRDFSIELVWKSDILDGPGSVGRSSLVNSLLDFEMALKSPIFVGLTRSTFSNLVTYEKYSRTYDGGIRHFIYDTNQSLLFPRKDYGAGSSPRVATTGIFPPRVGT